MRQGPTQSRRHLGTFRTNPRRSYNSIARRYFLAGRESMKHPSFASIISSETPILQRAAWQPPWGPGTL